MKTNAKSIIKTIISLTLCMYLIRYITISSLLKTLIILVEYFCLWQFVEKYIIGKTKLKFLDTFLFYFFYKGFGLFVILLFIIF